MKNSVYCAGVLFYVFIGIVYFQILKRYDNLAVPNAIYQCLSVLAVTLLSLVVLKEKISMIKMMGILIILVGLGIVSFSK
jgi:multidrug transporter EmrE-like cation transporter